jgi:hypothetical protein
MKPLKKGSTILVLLVAVSVYSQQSDWKKLDLKDKVKSVEIISYVAGEKFGKISKMGILEGEQYQFNENGLVTQKKRYGKQGLPIDQVTYKYDTLSNLIEQNIFDKKGILQRKILREYNQFNKNTFESVYGPDGTLINRSILQYKDGIIPQKILTFDKKGRQINLKEYIYNKKTEAKSITTTNPKSKIIERAEKYDNRKNLTNLYEFDVEGNLKSYIRYKYDENNNLIESSYYLDDVLLVKRTLKYNNLGFLVEVSALYPEKDKKDIITYKYDFDEKSNWIEQVEYVNSIPVRVKERKIVYY